MMTPLMPAKNSVLTRWPAARPILLWLILLALVMLPRLLNLDIFVGPDELAELGRDNNFALALAKGDLAGTLVGDGKPSVTLMWVNTLGVAGQWLWGYLSGHPVSFEQLVAPERPFSVWPERRMFLALVSGLQILAAWPLLRLIWDEQVATLAVGLLALEPFLLAFTRMIRGDSLLAGFMILSLLGALAFLKTGQARYNGFSGAMAGLAVLTKLSGGTVALTIILLYALAAYKREDEKGISSFRLHPSSFLGWGVAAVVIFFSLWPAWWFRPLETFSLLWNKGYYHATEAANQQAALYFWGAVHPFGPGPWFYPVLAALRLTPWLLLGSVLATGRWLWQTIKQPSAADLNILGLLLYVGLYGLAITLPGQKLDRFLLPVIPGLAILTAVEIKCQVLRVTCQVSGVTFYAPRTTHHAPRFISFAAILLIAALTWHVGRYHPLYSTYFNPLSGGPEFWAWALPIGHGEGVDEALRHLSTQPGINAKTLVCGTNLPRCQPFFPGRLRPQEDLRSAQWFKADYVLWHVDEQQLGLFPPGVLAYLRRQPQLYVAHYHGLDYTWLYAVPRPAFLVGSKLEGVATLFGYDAGSTDLTALKPGDSLKLHLYWQNEGQAQQQRFWWRLVDPQGYVWSEAAAAPLPEFSAAAAQLDAVVEGQASLALPPDLPPGAYSLRAGFANAAGEVGQFTLPEAGSSLQVTGWPVGPTEPSHVTNVQVAPDLRLHGYDLSSAEATPGETVWVTLHWQALDTFRRDYQVSLRLVDKAGQIVAAWDGRPVYGRLPTMQWPAGAALRDPWPLPLGHLPPARYSLELALADAATGQQLGPAVGLDRLIIIDRKANFVAPPMQFQAGAAFGPIATLLGYGLSGVLKPDGAQVTVVLYWQAGGPTPRPYQVHLRLVDETGQILAEQTAEPAVPSSEWQPAEIISDAHELAISGRKPASVRMEISLVDAAGQPLPLADGTTAYGVAELQQKVMWRTK